MLLLPHLPDQENWKQEPWCVGQQHQWQVLGRCGAKDLFAADDKNVGKQNRHNNDGRDPDPFFAFNEGVNRGDIKRTEKDDIEPDSCFPPGGPEPLQGIEISSTSMGHVDQERQRPEGIVET